MNTIIIDKPSDWCDFDTALIDETEGYANSVSRVQNVEELSGDSSLIEVVTSELSGQADLALEIFWNDSKKRSDKAVGTILALAIGSDVIVPDDSANPHTWILQRPEGRSELITLNLESLDVKQIVEYKMQNKSLHPTPSAP